MCGTIHLIIFAATVDIHTGDGSIITQMDYFTLAVSRLDHGLNTSFRLRMFCWMHAFQLPMFPLVHSWMLLLLYLLWGSVSCDCHTGMDVSHRFLSWIQFQVLHRNQLRLFSMSSRRTPCGRTPLTESGLAFSVVRPLQTVEYMRPAFDMRLKE